MNVTLIDHLGTDLTVVNAARVSFSKHKEVFDEKDERLINYLAKHNHWTPFAHPQIMVREKVPIFIARQRFKHMIGFTYNEVSRRYVDDEPEFFEPEYWRARPEGSVKQGSSGKHELNDFWNFLNERVISLSLDTYEEMIDDGVAPEQARMVLPQSMYTEYYVTGSLSAWARAYRQRIDNTAQKEIQELAKKWKEIIEPLFPHSWKALTE